MADKWDEFDDQFEVDSSDVSASDVDSGGRFVDKEGWYHFEVSEVIADLDRVTKDGKAKAPLLKFKMVVLESVPGQSPAGSMYMHRLYFGSKDGPMSDGGRNMIIKCGLRMGVLKQVDGKVVDAETGSSKWGPKVFARAAKSQLVGEVKEEEADDDRFGPRFNVPFQQFYQVDDPQVSDVPKNKEMLEIIGKAHAAPSEADIKAAAERAKKKSSGGEKRQQPHDDIEDDF